MDKTLKAQIAAFEKEAEQLSDIKEDVFNMKADLTIKAVGALLKKLNTAIDELLEGIHIKEENNRGLASAIKDAIERIISEFSQQKPPDIKVNVDMKPVVSMAEAIAKRSDMIVDAMNKLAAAGNKEDPAHRQMMGAVMGMIEMNTEFIQKGLKQFDYTQPLGSIEKAIVNKQTEWEAVNIKYNDLGRLERFTIRAIK